MILYAIFLLSTALLAHADDAPYKKANDTICPSEYNCKVTKSCQCWCSHKCGPRDKVADDKPVFLMSDPNGNYCYCNEWDLLNYDRCMVKDAAMKASSNTVKW